MNKIIVFLRKYYVLSFLLFLIFIYLILRLSFISRFSIEADEAIYIEMVKEVFQDPVKNLFYSLQGAREPLFIWIASLFTLIPNIEPLIAIRLVSVFSGVFSMIGLFFLTRKLFQNTKTALISSAIYAIFPFAQVYDTLGLLDGMVGTFYVWILYFMLVLINSPTLRNSIILGFVMGIGLLLKTNTILLIGLLPLILFILKKNKKEIFRNFEFIITAFIPIAIAIIIGFILVFQEYYWKLLALNVQIAYRPWVWLDFPLSVKFDIFINNFSAFFWWVVGYMKLPYILLIIFSFINRIFVREKMIALLCFLIPFLFLSVVIKTQNARYIFPQTLLLIPVVAFGIYSLSEEINKKIFFKNKLFIELMIFFISISFSLVSIISILINPLNSFIPKDEINLHYNTKFRDIAVIPSVEYLIDKSQKGPILVGFYKIADWYPNEWISLLWKKKNISLKTYPRIDESIIPETFLEDAKKFNGTSYFVTRNTLFMEKNNILNFPIIPVLKLKNSLDINKPFIIYKVNIIQDN